jgi:hypothetical protein
MRCIIVNGAILKAETCCTHCGSKIGDRYIREIGSRLIYCDYRCYGIAFKSSVAAIGFLAPSSPRAWTRGS